MAKQEALRAFARYNRKNMPPAEAKLWSCLSGAQCNFKFSRQVCLGDYIVDFACRQRRLAVELDGEPHLWNGEQDQARTEVLKSLGYEVIRFWNHEVFEDTEAVVAAIVAACEARPQWRY